VARRFQSFLNAGIGERYQDFKGEFPQLHTHVQNDPETLGGSEANAEIDDEEEPSQLPALPNDPQRLSLHSEAISEADEFEESEEAADVVPFEMSLPGSSFKGVSGSTVKARNAEVAHLLQLSGMEDRVDLPCPLALSAILRAERNDRDTCPWDLPSPRADIDRIRLAWTLATGLEEPVRKGATQKSFLLDPRKDGSRRPSRSSPRSSPRSSLQLQRISIDLGMSSASLMQGLQVDQPPVPEQQRRTDTAEEKDWATIVLSRDPWVVYENCCLLAQKHKVSVSEVKRSLEIFRTVDTNGNGTLDREEFAEAVRRRCHLESECEIPSHLIDEHWSCTNQDDDQVIDFQEFLLWQLRCEWDECLLVPSEREREMRHLAKQFRVQVSDVEFVRKVFDSFDEDGSGEIDKDEFKLLFCKLNKQKASDIPDLVLERYWLEADQDFSGCINFSEFLMWWYHVMHGQNWR